MAALVELRVPFTLDRQQIDDVARGSQDSDWQPVKDAARQLAFAEDRAVFEGYQAAGITGIRAGIDQLAADAARRSCVITRRRSPRHSASSGWPAWAARTRCCSAPTAYTAVSETSDHGYPLLEHINRLLSGEIVWAPAISGAIVLTTRGGDFDLQLGQDVAIGYQAHSAAEVELYLQETMTFLMYTGEAAVALVPAAE